MATNVKYDGKPKFKPCILCNSFHGSVTVDHPIFKCAKLPTSASKIDRLKIIKACVSVEMRITVFKTAYLNLSVIALSAASNTLIFFAIREIKWQINL